MAIGNFVLASFNKGLISKLGQARVDLKRTAVSAELQTNYMPRTLGSMMLRPSFAYTGTTNGSALAYHLDFVFSNSDTAILELTDETLRVKLDETPITRSSVSSALTNGTFTTDLTGWTDADEAGATSSWVAGDYLSLVGTGFNRAIRTQQVTVSGADASVEHALRIIVLRGEVKLRVGTASGTQEYISETTLKTGEHSLAFTPTANFYVWLAASTQYASLVDSCTIESSGVMELPTPWTEANLGYVRYKQSADVVFCAGNGVQQRRIERRGTRSWSVVLYAPDDGPFMTVNTSSIRLTPSGLTGDISLIASSAFFTSGNVGSLFRITSIGQTVVSAFTGEDQFSSPSVRVTGVSTQRNMTITRTGTWSGTLTLQRSIDEDGAWTDVTTYTTNASITYNDALDNQIAYYRIGFKTGNYTSGTADVTLSYASGGLDGIVRIVSVADETTAAAIVLSPLGGTTGSSDWSEGLWSTRRGFPSTVIFDEGRLWWFGKDKIVASVSDAYESFDDTIEGESAPISRSIGEGPVDTISWALALKAIAIGGQGAEYVVQSSTLGEALTATNFNLKSPSTNGSARVDAVKMDDLGIFVQKSGKRLYQTSYSFEKDGFLSDDLMKLVPEIGYPGIIRIAVQRQPDTRIHAVLDDGTVAILIYDRAEEVNAWILVETDGDIEDAIVLPGDEEDKVYYTVKRTINGSTVRYLERWAMESECSYPTYIYDGTSTSTITDLPFPEGKEVTVRDSDGGKIVNTTVSGRSITLASAVTYAAITPTLYKLADSHIVYDGTATTTITGLSSLEGEDVVVWADGKDFSPGVGSDQTTYTVSSGSITLSEAVEQAVVGLPYRARFKGTKLAYLAEAGTALNQKKKINYLGLILSDTHKYGIRYGQDFDNMDSLPETEDEKLVDDNHVHSVYDHDMMEFDGMWSTDSRICLESNAPRPCTCLAAVVGMQVSEKL